MYKTVDKKYQVPVYKHLSLVKSVQSFNSLITEKLEALNSQMFVYVINLLMFFSS